MTSTPVKVHWCSRVGWTKVELDVLDVGLRDFGVGEFCGKHQRSPHDQHCSEDIPTIYLNIPGISTSCMIGDDAVRLSNT